MNILFRFLLVGIVAFSGYTPASIASEPQKMVIIEIVHSHKHDVRHHHHHHHEEDTKESDSYDQSVVSQPESNSPSNSTNKHTHEILISYGQTIFIESKPEFVIEFKLGSSHPAPQDISAPRYRSLSSIFRPPILA